MMKKLQFLSFSLVLSVLVATFNVAAEPVVTRSLVADMSSGTYEQLKNTDQPVFIFKAPSKAKYPWALYLDPRTNQWNFYLMGTYNEKYNENRLAKSSKDLANLSVLRSITTFVDGGGIKIDKEYQGYREPYAAQALVKVGQLLGLGSSEEYKGIILVDEYNNGLPMKWVLSSADDVQALSRYFKKQGVVPAETKPLLLIELLDAKKAMSNEAIAFLNTYFTMLDGKDTAVKAFFANADDFYSNAFSNSSGAKNVLETPMATFFRKVIDDKAEGLDAKKLVGVVASGLVVKLVAEIGTDMLKGTEAYKTTLATLQDLFTVETGDKKVPSDKVKLGLGIAGGAVAAYILYKIVADIVKANDADADEDTFDVIEENLEEGEMAAA